MLVFSAIRPVRRGLGAVAHSAYYILIGSPSDNGPEFAATRVQEWQGRVGLKTLFIETGSPWGDGYIESFNGQLQDELLDREIFDTLLEAKVLMERWRPEYNTVRPHSSLGYRPPAPDARLFTGRPSNLHSVPVEQRKCTKRLPLNKWSRPRGAGQVVGRFSGLCCSPSCFGCHFSEWRFAIQDSMPAQIIRFFSS